ncbi:MAG: DUF1700 domain-containing protein [Oscillospiraceae bacterium]|nr:DUF1700 domain-containing protein [Oscillospiraceae bacterium]
MNRKQFLQDLRRELEALPFEERETAVTYYEEYFDEAGPEREQETISGFGTPAKIAAQLKAEYAVNKPPKTPKEGFSKVWMVILAIFAFPLAFPLAIVIAALIFTLFAVFVSIIFAFGISAVALVLGGLACIVGGFAVIAASPATTLFFVGGGIAILGIGIIFAYGSHIVATKLMGAFARLLGRMLSRMRERKTS